MTRREQAKCIPFDSSKWWDWRTKYSIDNMLVREVHFPEAVHTPEDKILDDWSDRSPDAWAKAWEVFRKPQYENTNYLAKLRSSSPEDFLEFCSVFLVQKVDGARLVRFSTTGGYEVYLVTGVVIKAEETRRERFDCSDRSAATPSETERILGGYFHESGEWRDRG